MKSKSKKTRRRFSAIEKSKAVLAVWNERRTVTEMCEELSLSSGQFSKWQNLAMEGMLSALESRRDQEKPPPLNSRLERLLEKKVSERNHTGPKPSRLEQRLENIQKSREKPNG
jgi:transposase-like protein